MDLNQKEFTDNNKCCSDCKTTKTPLWRGGPAGPKSLCNACGIRYRKRRVSTVGLKLKKGQERKKERRHRQSGGGGGGKDLKEFLKMKLMALGEEVLLQQSQSVVKKQKRRKLGEVEEAAVCLMALSCGFVFA
ncbi:GATA transcription factor 16 [Senna tora]|uniref:GATA transcription factor 16 n=1 Tax=Senna tora TaxID=362788 RepID=A0A834WCY0_9FABA|nr:GATA transcription factor 16 [Senna tora]